jgi:hypothetical protein
VERLGAGEPAALARLREVVAGRRARITLDDETVDVWFERGRLITRPSEEEVEVTGGGATDRLTTLDLLNGYLEVTDAILDGRLLATGEIENLARIMQAIEILLDGSTRIPALQQLARDYRVDPCRAAAASRVGGERRRRAALDAPADDERELLGRLGLLP